VVSSVMLAACLIRLRACSADVISFSLLMLVNVHGLIWMSSFLPEASIWSLSILINSFRALYFMFEVSFVIIKLFTNWYEYTAAAVVLLHSIAAYFVSFKKEKNYFIQFIFSAKDP
jgi:hypothetical protein